MSVQYEVGIHPIVAKATPLSYILSVCHSDVSDYSEGNQGHRAHPGKSAPGALHSECHHHQHFNGCGFIYVENV